MCSQQIWLILPVIFPFLRIERLHEHLKYVYLGEQETFPVIIPSHLNDE